MTSRAHRSSVSVQAIASTDRDWARSHWEHAWGSVKVARRNELLDLTTYPGFIARLDGERAGVAVSGVRDGEYEVLAVSASLEGAGVGQALMRRCLEDAAAQGCCRVWLTTTNDNLRAIAFYQRLGMTMCAFHRDAVDAARRLKPSIPLLAANGIAIDHELEFELRLSASR